MIDGCYRFSFDGDCRDAAQHILFHDFVGVPRGNVIVRWCSSGYINRLEWITCVEDAVSCCRRRFAVCMDFGQARAFIEAPISQTGDGVGNRDARQARAYSYLQLIVYQLVLIKTVEKWRLWFYRWRNKSEFNIFNFVNKSRIQQADANLQQVIEEVLNWHW